MKKMAMLYSKSFSEPMTDYRLFKVVKPIDKQVYILFIFAFLILVWFVLDLFSIIPKSIGILEFLIAFIVLFAFPMIYVFKFKGRRILFTKRALLKATFLGKTIIIPWDDISNVKTNHNTFLTIYSLKRKSEIKIQYTLYDVDIKQINELLKYKGFFMETPKDYSIELSKGNLKVNEAVEKIDEVLPALFEKYFNEYTYLTPGFIDEIIFYNNRIERLDINDKKHIALYLSHLDVKPGHPENTKFKAQKTDEAFVLFENVDKVSIHALDKDDSKRKPITESIETLQEITNKAVIYESSLKITPEDQKIVFVLSSSVQKYSVEVTYKQVIIGWNAFIDLSWFEQTL